MSRVNCDSCGKGGDEATRSPGVSNALHEGHSEPGGRAHAFPAVKREAAFNYAQVGGEMFINVRVADCEMKSRLLNCSVQIGRGVAKTWTSGCTRLRLNICKAFQHHGVIIS